MNKTIIEWVKNPDGSLGYTWNPITGCLNHDNGLCKGGGFPCFAYKSANGRLKPLYLRNLNIALPNENPKLAFDDPFYPHFWEERLYHPWDGKPKGIFVCDMGDLFGIGVPEEWTNKVLNLCRLHDQNRYYLLTKQPQRLPEFSPFPDNCWVGVTATNQEMLIDALAELHRIEARIKYISLEPLLEAMNGGECEGKRLDGLAEDIDWLIIGACTGTLNEIVRLCEKYPDLAGVRYGNKWTALPPIEWVKEIVEAADKAGIKVFLKENLRPLLPIESPFYKLVESNVQWGNSNYELRQELPNGRQKE